MGRRKQIRRNNAAPRAAATLQANLHAEWASTTGQTLCERHIGEAHPPRCAECDLETVRAAGDQVQRRLDRKPVNRMLEQSRKSQAIRRDFEARQANQLDIPDEQPAKINRPCPVCGNPSHWANASQGYLHPECAAMS